jgi:aminomethyltransferase
MRGYAAFYDGAALLDLSARGRIAAAGEDRKRLLHALSTSHVEQLEPGQGCYAFFLNAQGRVLADAVILCRADSLLLSVEPETRGKVFAHIDRYIIADDVTLTDETEASAELALEGPQAAVLLESLAAPLPSAGYHFAEWDGVLIGHWSATGAPGYRLIATLEAAAELRARLAAAGAVEATAEEARLVRLEHGLTRYGEDISEAQIAHETGQLHAIHFSKGCYVGQEIVERVRSRGSVNRKLVALDIDAAQPPAAGAKVMAGEKEAGAVTSSAYSPRLGKTVALGYLRVELLGGPLTVEGAAAQAFEKR